MDRKTTTALKFAAAHQQILTNMDMSDDEFRNLPTTDGQEPLGGYIVMAALREATRD
jgi:hypothetical protein